MIFLPYLFTYSNPTLSLPHYYFFLLSLDPWSVNVNGLRMLKGDGFMPSESSFLSTVKAHNCLPYHNV